MSLETRDRDDRVCRRAAWAAGGVAFAVYAATLSVGAFPGESAALLANHSGYAPFPALTHMGWGWAILALKAIPVGALSFKASLLSATCGGIAVGLLFRLVAALAAMLFRRSREARGGRMDEGESLPEPSVKMTVLVRHGFSSGLAVRLVSGSVAAVALAFSAPFWIAATRAHTGAFDLAWFLFTALAMLQYLRTGVFGRLGVAALAYGALVAEAPAMSVFAPFYLVVALGGMVQHEHLSTRWTDEWRRGPPVVGYAFLCALLVVTGFVLTIGCGAGQFALSPAAAWAGPAGFPHAALEVLRACWRELRADVPQLGWLLLPLVTALPVAMLAMAVKALTPVPRPASFGLGFLLAAFAVAIAFNAPFAPWPMFRFAPLYVAPYAVFAAWAGLVAGVLAQMILVDLTRFNVLRFLAPVFASEGRRRGVVAGIVALYVVPLLAAGALNFRLADGRLAKPFTEFAARVVAECEGLTWLVTQGAFDDLILIEAAERKAPLRVVNLRMGRHPPYLRYMASLFDADPRLQGLAAAGMEPLTAEWFARDSGVVTNVAVLDTPDLWVNAGYRLAPGRLVYRGATNAVPPPPADLKAWGAEVATLRRNVESAPAPVRQWGEWVIRHASRLMNDRGVAAEEAEAADAASGWYDAAIAAADDNVSARINRLRLARRTKRADAADLDAELTRFLTPRGGAVDPVWAAQVYGLIRAPEAAIERGVRMAASGRLQPAMADFAQAMQFDGENDRTVLSLAHLLSARGRPREGKELLDQLIRREPTNVVARLALANHAMRSGDFKTAHECLDSLAGETKVERSVRLATAYLAALEGNPMAGAQAVDARLAQKPDDAEAWTMSAVLALQRGDIAAVRKADEVLTRMNRRTPPAMYAMAWVQLQEGRAFDGRRLLEDLTIRAPAFTPGWELLVRLDYAERRRDLAEKHVHQLLRLDSGNALANQFLASFQIEQGRFAQAEASLRAALERRREPSTLNDLAWALLKQGNAAGALPLIEEAVGLRPADGALQDTRGMVLTALNRFDPARTAFKKAIELLPDDMEIKAHLAELDRKSGKSR